MSGEANCGTQDELERLRVVASRYCTCGWVNPLRVGKPECNAHALFTDQLALSRLVYTYRMRSRLLNAEFG
jgi:hypothetical protein